MPQAPQRRPSGALILIVAFLWLAAACRSEAPPAPAPTADAPAAVTADVAEDVETVETDVPEADAVEADAVDAPDAEKAPEPVATVAPLTEVRSMLRAGHRKRAIETLKISVPTWEGTDKSAGHFILGRMLTDDDDPAGLAQLQKLPAPFEDFESLRLVWLSRALLLNTQDKAAIETIDALIKNHPRLKELPQLRLERARAMHRLGQKEDAIGALSGVKGDRRLQSVALRQKADWLRPEALDKAKPLDKRLLMQYPDEPATRAPGLSIAVTDLSLSERHKRARTLMRRWQYEEARAEFRHLIEKKYALYDARWNVAVISLRKLRDNPVEAREMLHKVLKANGPHTEEAYYLLMRTFMREENYEQARKVSLRYDDRYPTGKYKELLSYYRAWLPYDHNDCKTAIPRFRNHLKDATEKRSLVMGFYAWCFVRLEMWPQAVRAFGAMIPLGNSVVRGKAHYWRAVALDKMDRRKDAIREIATLRKTYPLTYYDMLAQQLLATWEGRDPRASKLPWPEGGGRAHLDRPLDPEMWDLARPRGAYKARFAKVRRLIELHELERARAAWRGIRGPIENTVPIARRNDFIRFMGHQVEDYKHGWQKVSGGSISSMTNLPDASDPRWMLAYPRAYAPMVERLSDEFGLPSHFVYAIMRQESRYNPAAVSHTDAVGALQMIPQTARKVADDMGVQYDPKTFPRPSISFRYSLYYLRKLAQTFKGQLIPTAASYNGGPQPIARWMRETPGADLGTLVEEFAYNESRIYCRKVAEHTLRYLYLYEADPEVRGKWLDALFPVKVDYDIPEDVGY